jgi:hypothetical protein
MNALYFSNFLNFNRQKHPQVAVSENPCLEGYRCFNQSKSPNFGISSMKLRAFGDDFLIRVRLPEGIGAISR